MLYMVWQLVAPPTDHHLGTLLATQSLQWLQGCMPMLCLNCREEVIAAALAARRELLVKIASGLLSAISYCHQRGVAHCGIGAGKRDAATKPGPALSLLISAMHQHCNCHSLMQLVAALVRTACCCEQCTSQLLLLTVSCACVAASLQVVL